MTSVSVSVCLCVHVSVCNCISVCVCGVSSFITLVSLACMPNEPKSAKCEFFKNFVTLRILLADTQFISYG